MVEHWLSSVPAWGFSGAGRRGRKGEKGEHEEEARTAREQREDRELGIILEKIHFSYASLRRDTHTLSAPWGERDSSTLLVLCNFLSKYLRMASRVQERVRIVSLGTGRAGTGTVAGTSGVNLDQLSSTPSAGRRFFRMEKFPGQRKTGKRVL